MNIAPIPPIRRWLPRLLLVALASPCTTSVADAGAVAELEEVIVTASLRGDVAGEVAASLTVIGDATIRAAGVEHLQDLLPLVPNLNWAAGSSRPRYFQLRGIGETDQWQGAPNPSVGFLIDGMDFSGIGMPAGLLDLQQVEVLRGPQGTLYGANALAGLINLRTHPADGEATAHMEFSGAQYGTSAAGAVLGGAFCRDCSAAWRVVGQRFRSDGFRRNTFLGRDDTNGHDESTLRARLAFEPTPQLRLDVAALWVDDDNGYDAFALDNSRDTRSDKPGRDAQRSRGLSLSADYTGPAAFKVRSVTAWTDADIVYSFDGDWGADPGYDFTSRFLRRHRTLSEDLRLVSRSDAESPGGIAWAAGLYVLDLKESNDQLDLYNGAVDRALVSEYSATSSAAYGQVKWRVSPAWSLQFGARAEQRSARYRDSDDGDFGPVDRMLGGNASLEYRFDPARSAYLTLARGYKAGGFNIGAAVPADRREFAPELLTSLEAGYRQSAVDGRLDVQASLFYMRRMDQQVSTSAQLDPADPLTFIYLTDNASRGENRGAEIALSWRATDVLRFGATAGWLSTRYLGYAIGSRSLDGRSQAHAPSQQFSFSAEYRASEGWFARADASHVASFYFSESHDQRSRPYSLLNLRAGYAAASWELSIWARNLFDAGYTQRGFFFGNEPPDFPDKLYVQPGDPRQVGATLRVDLR